MDLELTDNPDEWYHHSENIWDRPGGIWQNKRNGKALSCDGGKTYTLVDEEDENHEQTVYFSAPAKSVAP